MAIVCPECGQQFDVTLFQFGRVVACDCGRSVSLSFPLHSARAKAEAEEQSRAEEETEKAEEDA